MRGPRVLRPKASLALLTGLLLAVSLTACGGSDESARAGEPRPLVTSPPLKPGFTWKQKDYVLRCEGESVTVDDENP